MMLSTKTVRDLGLEKMIDRKGNLYSVKNALGNKMNVVGSIHLWLHIDRAPWPCRVHFIVSDDLTDTLVGCSDLILLGVLPTNFPTYLHAKGALQAKAQAQDEEEEKAMEDTSHMNFEQVPYEEIRNTLTEFTGVFRDRLSKKTRLKAPPMQIEMREDIPIKPLSVSTSRLIPVAWQTEVDKMIKGMLKARVIEPATKAGRWYSLSKFVLKPGDE